jgi:hypothetical protein
MAYVPCRSPCPDFKLEDVQRKTCAVYDDTYVVHLSLALPLNAAHKWYIHQVRENPPFHEGVVIA